MIDGALPLHGYTLSAAAQMKVMTVLEHVSLSRVLPVEQLFFFTSVVILDVGSSATRVRVVQPAITIELMCWWLHAR